MTAPFPEPHSRTLDFLREQQRAMIQDVAARMAVPGLISTRPRQPIRAPWDRPAPMLAPQAFPAKITLDGSLPSCSPPVGAIRRATPTTQREKTMTTTHTPTPQQAARLWAVDQAREKLATTSTGALFAGGSSTLSDARKVDDLISLADYLVGYDEEIEEEDAFDVIQRRIHDMTPEQAAVIAAESAQHSHNVVTLLSDISALAAAKPEQVSNLVERLRGAVDGLPQRVAEYREQNGADIDEFVEDVLKPAMEDDPTTTASEADGSLVVEKHDADAELADTFEGKVQPDATTTPDLEPDLGQLPNDER